MDLHNWREWSAEQFALDAEAEVSEDEIAASYAATNPHEEVE
jgi:hypothetical protein